MSELDLDELPPAASVLEDVLDQLHVTLGDMRIYGPRHRVTQRRLGETFARIDEVLRTFGTLRLQSGLDGLSWDGLVVRTEDESREGLGRLLHREGIKAVVLQQGLDRQELQALLEALRVNLSLPEYEEETLESLIWQAGLQCVEVEALQELQDAEQLSGDLWQRGDVDVAGAVIRELLEVRHQGERNQIGAPITEQAVNRAVARSDLSGLGGEGDGAHGVTQLRDWMRRFNREGSEDHEEIERERSALAADTPGGLLAHLTLLLLRVGLEDRDELRVDQALEFARTCASELFRRGLSGGVARLLEGVPALLQQAPPEVMGRMGPVLQFSQWVAEPNRILHMLLELDPAHHDDPEGLSRLVEKLPDGALEQLLEMASRQLTGDRRVWLLELLGEAAQGRFEVWLGQLDRQPQQRVVALIGLLRGLDSPKGRALRPDLMRHPSREVREATLQWYRDDLPAEEAAALVSSLVDRSSGVRRAAREVFERHRSPQAYTFLRMEVEGARFDRYDPEIKTDLCVALGSVGGDLGVDALLAVFDRPIGVFGQKERALELEAAARGLAAAGNVKAKVALEKGASSLNPTRRAVSQSALEWMRRRR